MGQRANGRTRCQVHRGIWLATGWRRNRGARDGRITTGKPCDCERSFDGYQTCWQVIPATACTGDVENETAKKNVKGGCSMLRFVKRMLLAASACCLWVGVSAIAQDVPAEYQDVLKTLDKKGDFKAGVLKVNIPRSDLKITVQGVATPTPFGFGGWVALTKASDGSEVMTGDLVLLQEEVNPVMSALLDHGIDVTALHNHFFWDDPHVYYMHVHGMGKAADLAQRVKPGLDLIGHVKPPPTSPMNASAKPIDTAKIAKIVGHEGEQSGAVYKITVGRDDIGMKEHGAAINSRMGLNTWAAFYGSEDDAVVAGDIAMLESELTPVLKTLRSNGIEVVAIHHHMTEEKPMVIFLHYWGRGSSEKLANAFKATLGDLGKKG